MRISVVTVTHNSEDVIVGMLTSLPAGVEVIVVDNASTDGSRAAVRAARPDAVIVELTSNGGFGHGCNVGAERATGDVLVLLNPDCRPRAGSLGLLADAVRGDRRSIFGPALFDADGSLRHNMRRPSRPIHEMLEILPAAVRWVPRRWRRDVPAQDARYRTGGDVAYLQGACLAISRARFRELGGFDTDFFLYSEEETLCLAVQTTGGRCRYLPSAQVVHVAETSTRKTGAFAIRHAYRSRAIFYRKRYGEVGGLLATAGIAIATALSWLIRPRANVSGEPRNRRDATQVEILRGLWWGARQRLTPRGDRSASPA